MVTRRPRPALAAFALAAIALLLPDPARAQSPVQLLRSIAQGGGWISIPVTEGVGTIRTDTVPTLGIKVEGCLTVWPGHSGEFTVAARDPLNDESLDAVAKPGQGVPFSYQAGPRSALDVKVEWSEPRDTTLIVWIGVKTRNPDRDACEPRYSGG
jgi:hypothetical protein